jgi:hypothetical protein
MSKENMRRFSLPLTVAGLMLIVGCRSTAPSNSSDSNGEAASAPNCTEPENPYEEGSGHYAGYEWAESSGSGTCGGNSQSFIEGCEEYESQEDAYQECEAMKQN